MKRILTGGLLAAATLLGGLAFTSTTVSANSNGVPTCDGTFIENQPPSSGTSVTAAYTGTMYIKIGSGGQYDGHYPVAATAGVIYSPSNVPGWPLSEGGNPQGISHVDYCVPDAPPVEVTPEYTYTPPTCAAPGSVSFPQDEDGYEWVDNEDGTYTAVPDEGFVLPEDFEETVGPFALDQLTGEQCETTTTTATTQPPGETISTPAPAAPQTQVAAAGPVPPAAAPAAAPPAPAQSSLPSTGSSSWGLALTALASLLGGLGLVKLSRRTS